MLANGPEHYKPDLKVISSNLCDKQFQCWIPFWWVELFAQWTTTISAPVFQNRLIAITFSRDPYQRCWLVMLASKRNCFNWQQDVKVDSDAKRQKMSSTAPAASKTSTFSSCFGKWKFKLEWNKLKFALWNCDTESYSWYSNVLYIDALNKYI